MVISVKNKKINAKEERLNKEFDFGDINKQIETELKELTVRSNSVFIIKEKCLGRHRRTALGFQLSNIKFIAAIAALIIITTAGASILNYRSNSANKISAGINTLAPGGLETYAPQETPSENSEDTSQSSENIKDGMVSNPYSSIFQVNQNDYAEGAFLNNDSPASSQTPSGENTLKPLQTPSAANTQRSSETPGVTMNQPPIIATPAGDFVYEYIDSESIMITAYKGSVSDVVVPSEIDGKKVVSIGNNAFYQNNVIKTIKLPASINNIGDYSFCFTSLKSINIPDGVTYIGNYAFGYSKIETIDIPDSVTWMPAYAFYDCESLKSVNIGSGLKASYSGEPNFYGDFMNCYSLLEINVDADNPYCMSENGILFSKDKSVIIKYPAAKPDTEYTIPYGVTKVEYAAFDSCSKLVHIYIPDSVTYISDFKGCSGLTDITLPSSLTSIRDGLFEGCTNLTAIYVDGYNPKYYSENGVLYYYSSWDSDGNIYEESLTAVYPPGR